jgi:hypothetical protein
LVAGARSAYRVVSGGLEVEPGSVRQVFLDPAELADRGAIQEA